ncbi:zonular occludens toxin domain-containing protein [Pseudomonas sp. 2FE]|uniref:zonular occludens toxin domain-containing protein n=1 Tax=Pseudomonas sp. 2FE TaxID=2502190 RepID=UPI0010F9467D|nr:zonular occludens toxin domain-containing protein [Pseudomonas sp. 2FE]
MFVLRTGLQGNGKTLNTIKEVDQKAHAENRTVYYCNVTGFNPGHPAIKANWLLFDTPEKWFELPPNAIIVIDEAQTWFRVRPQGSKVPEYASRLEIMRKDGHELHAITQSPKLIDSHMRELCNRHIHYHRGNGGSVIKRWEFQKPELTVNANKLAFDNGESTRIMVDKTYFGCYESVKEGTGHHFKFRPPRALLVLIGCLIVGAVLGYRFYTHRIAPTVLGAETVEPVDSAQVAPTGVSSSMISTVGEVVTPQQYIDARIPRVPDVPSSAPIYDQLTKPVTYPKTFCVASKDESLLERAGSKMTLGYQGSRLYGCRCNTQQGTKVDISFDACMAYVEHGAFDPAKPDPSSSQQQAAGSVGPGEGRAGTTERAAQRDSLTVVADSEYASRPWRSN